MCSCVNVSPVNIFASVICALTEGDETGVMDSLMEALQSGAAFRDRRKRTPRNGKSLKNTVFMSQFILCYLCQSYLSARVCMCVCVRARACVYIRVLLIGFKD